jgi:hypothetical protein
MSLYNVSAILADVQQAIGRIIKEIKSFKTEAEPAHNAQVRKRRRISSSSNGSSPEVHATVNKGPL